MAMCIFPYLPDNFGCMAVCKIITHPLSSGIRSSFASSGVMRGRVLDAIREVTYIQKILGRIAPV